MTTPKFEELLPHDSIALDSLRKLAHQSAYNLLEEMNNRATKTSWLQVATTESLTAGLILSTLVDIPFGGYLKYGGFGVYDTDAKRVFNGVKVDDVYTHRCAKEMAIGVLKNSNATLAVAVTGNAMPLTEHVDMLAEVFIGIAGYDASGNIIFITQSINACIENDIEEFKQTCKAWHKTIKIDKKYNSRSDTALVSQEIRNYTTYKALALCLDFIKNANPQVPLFILDRKRQNNEKDASQTHTLIPDNKYPITATETCVNKACIDTDTPDRVDTKLYTSNGGRKIRTRRRRRTQKRI
jgi:nicotinamide-nucleotide amidase